jgi:hypothetical protein
MISQVKNPYSSKKIDARNRLRKDTENQLQLATLSTTQPLQGPILQSLILADLHNCRAIPTNSTKATNAHVRVQLLQKADDLQHYPSFLKEYRQPLAASFALLHDPLQSS